MKKTMIYDLLLLATLLISGLSFPLTKMSFTYVDLAPFLTVKTAAAAVCVFIFAALRWRGKPGGVRGVLFSKNVLKAGLLAGMVYFTGTWLQIEGLRLTSVVNGAFIVGVYVLMIPAVSLLFRGRPDRGSLLGLAVCAVGLMLVCGVVEVSPRGLVIGFSAFNLGDLLTLLSAFLWAFYINLIHHVGKNCDTLAYTFWQLVFFLPPSLLIWGLFFPAARADFSVPFMALSLLVNGVMIAGFNLVILMHVQSRVSPTHAALLFSTEPAFAALCAMLIPDFAGNTERLSPLQAIGCALIFLAIAVTGFLAARRAPLPPGGEDPQKDAGKRRGDSPAGER